MTTRRPSQTTTNAVDGYASQYDRLFNRVSQRNSFRQYPSGLLLPLETNKHLRGIAAAVPGAEVEALQHFLVDAPWSVETVNAKRLEQFQQLEATHWHAQGVLIIDETGDRKKGAHSAYTSRQYLGSVGKLDNGVVCVSSHWASPTVHYPLEVLPYTAAERLPQGKQDAGFATKPALAQRLIHQARAMGVPFAAVVADSFYGEHRGLTDWLRREEIPFVMPFKPTHEIWQFVGDPEHLPAFSPAEAAQRVPAKAWQRMIRTFADGTQATWYVVDLAWGAWGTDRATRLVAFTSDRTTLPAESTAYLHTNIPLTTATAGEIARLYSLREWIEVFYKQAKNELGWADWQMRQPRAVLRHWYLVFCAYSLTLLHGLAIPPSKKRRRSSVG